MDEVKYCPIKSPEYPFNYRNTWWKRDEIKKMELDEEASIAIKEYYCVNRMEKNTEQILMDVLEWAKGNRGSKSGNPYMIPEIKSALKHLAKIQGRQDYLDAKTIY